MITKVTEKLFFHRLFADTDIDRIKEVLSQGKLELCSFAKNEIIAPPKKAEKHMAFVYRGSAIIHSKDQGTDAVIRKISQGEIFGVANLFLDRQDSVSTIIATTATEVLFIPSSSVKEMRSTDGNFAMNYISFLSDKICFLNRRIACFTSPSAESKLENYLYGLSHDGASVTLPVSLSTLADMLDIGRASLYRAFDKLENEGKIKRDGKTVTFIKNCQ